MNNKEVVFSVNTGIDDFLFLPVFIEANAYFRCVK